MLQRQKESTATYRRLHATLGRLIRWYFPVHIEGEVPNGQFIAYSAHTAVIDSYVILAALEARRSVKIPAKSEYFDDGDTKQRLIRWLVSHAGIPVDRDDRESGKTVLDALRTAIVEGSSLAYHPEGTRTDGQAVYRGKTGFVQVALETGVPLLPVVLHGTATANKQGSRRLKRSPIVVKFLPSFSVTQSPALKAVERIDESRRTDLIKRQIERLRKHSLEHSAREAMELLAAHQGLPYVNEDYYKRKKRIDRF